MGQIRSLGVPALLLFVVCFGIVCFEEFWENFLVLTSITVLIRAVAFRINQVPALGGIKGNLFFSHCVYSLLSPYFVLQYEFS
jgi:hypothetical protein